MNDSQFESIATGIADLSALVREHDLTELEQEIFYCKIVAIKKFMEREFGIKKW